MNTVNTAARKRADRDPDISNTSGRLAAPSLDTLFKGKATDFFSTFIHLSQLHKRINTGKAEIDLGMVDMIASLLLVIGSYFRKKDPGLMGKEKDGQPVDARGLFEKGVLMDTIGGIFHNYYEGFIQVLTFVKCCRMISIG
jgi:hypothetical protein